MSSVAASPSAQLSLRDRMTRDLQLRGLSARTQEAYLRAVRQLAAFYRLPPDQLNEEQLRDYFLHLKNHKQFAPNSLKIASRKCFAGTDQANSRSSVTPWGGNVPVGGPFAVLRPARLTPC
jgi:hypothetical protein